MANVNNVSFVNNKIIKERSAALNEDEVITGTPFAYRPMDGQDALTSPHNPVAFNFAQQKDVVDLFIPATKQWENCDCKSNNIQHMEMSPSDSTNWLNVKRFKTIPKSYRHRFGAKWGKILFTYSTLLEPMNSHLFILLLSANHKQNCCESCFIQHLKAISLVSLRLNIEMGPGWWSFFSDMHILGGYDTVLNRVDVLANYASTCQAIRGCDSKWLRDNISNTVTKIGGTGSSKQNTFEQFIRFRDNWALPGASTAGTPTLIQIGNYTSKPRKIRGKFANTLSYTDEQLSAEALAGHPARIFPFRKADEPTKTRVVQSYDMWSYLRCSYAESFFEDYNAHGEWTTAGMSVAQRAEARIRLLSHLKTKPKAEAISLDQSAFDEHQRKSLVRHAMCALWDHAIGLSRANLKPQLRRLKEADINSFDAAGVYSKKGRTVTKECDWLQGLPSGHKWTTLIDSLINKAESEYVCAKMHLELYDGLWQGDDAVLIVRGPVDKEVMTSIFNGMDLDVNPDKTWVSNVRFEFLHEVHGPEGVWAFPARVAKSCLWKKPELGNTSFTPPHLKIQERWDTFRKGIRRGLDLITEYRDDVISTIKKYSKTRNPVEVADAYLRTPLALGGGGLGTSGRVSACWLAPTVRYSKIKILTKVAFDSPKDTLVVHRAVMKRLGASQPLPASKPVFQHRRLARIHSPPSLGNLNGKLPKTDWVSSDFNLLSNGRPIDAWMYKLRLESCLSGKDKIPEYLCPSTALKNSPMGVDAAMRFLAKWSNESINLTNAFTNSEPFVNTQRYFRRLWHGMLSNVVTFGTRPTDLSVEFAKLGFAAWRQTHLDLVGVRVAV